MRRVVRFPVCDYILYYHIKRYNSWKNIYMAKQLGTITECIRMKVRRDQKFIFNLQPLLLKATMKKNLRGALGAAWDQRQ